MDYNAKQKLFAQFMEQWDEEFSKAQPIINYLSSYPIMLEKTRLMGTFINEGLEEHQLEWISLIAQLYHSVDSNFFKSYWVPILKIDTIFLLIFLITVTQFLSNATFGSNLTIIIKHLSLLK